MKWLNKLSELKISFHTFKLSNNDSIIYNNEPFNERSFVIISGLLYLQKIFLNGEKLCIAILTKNTLLSLDPENTSKALYYYQLVSLNTSYIISLHTHNLSTRKKQHINLILNMHKEYYKTLIAYERMIQILTHKYIKYRIIQLLLFLSKEEGNIINNTIIIPFYISQSNIGNIVGSNKNTVNKIIKSLEVQKIICYSNKKRIIIQDIIALNKAKLIL
uniref:Global nitrogen transcriptional regulator n=1 Tax=Gelidium kathyanniae TaxID=2483893 RepID=A0A3G2QY16_9FLOR|nr:global nitrogen transcriptional regulator [Gelidium kathyanniae]AYO27983.1 global nitrogen transcriptional regulator [Gelidium kathyanniae]